MTPPLIDWVSMDDLIAALTPDERERSWDAWIQYHGPEPFRDAELFMAFSVGWLACRGGLGGLVQ